MFKLYNFILNDWVLKVEFNLVLVDWFGFFIYEFIIFESVFDFFLFFLYFVVEYVKSVIEDYYQFNMYCGCIDIDLLNFLYMVNVDDGSCIFKGQNFLFGGIY